MPMKFLRPIRTVKVLAPGLLRVVRQYVRGKVPATKIYSAALAGKRALEIGGPSEIFGDHGSLPIYYDLSSVDNCLFSSETIWTGRTTHGRSFGYHPKKPFGTQFICDATDLKPIPPETYDCILASHCLEHVANPLLALKEWGRVLKPDGFLVVILPHKERIFDWRRPTTSLAHMREDYESNTKEDDLTHLSEILALHDLEMDEGAGSPDQFKIRCMNNHSNRSMHHHVFDTFAAANLVSEGGFQLIRIDPFKPCHIILLARRCIGLSDNAEFFGPNASYRHFSPFASDRVR
jgi:SAM-dependent methyltransferase